MNLGFQDRLYWVEVEEVGEVEEGEVEGEGGVLMTDDKQLVGVGVGEEGDVGVVEVEEEEEEQQGEDEEEVVL